MDGADVFRQRPGVRLADLSNEKYAGNCARVTETNVGVSHGDYCRCWMAFAATVQFQRCGAVNRVIYVLVSQIPVEAGFVLKEFATRHCRTATRLSIATPSCQYLTTYAIITICPLFLGAPCGKGLTSVNDSTRAHRCAQAAVLPCSCDRERACSERPFG